MFFTVKHLNWEKGDAINREARRDLCDGHGHHEVLASSVSLMGDAYERAATLRLEFPDAITVEEGLEVCFMLTNSIDSAWFESVDPRLIFKTRSRSTSVGDLVQVDRRLFICAPAGWVELIN